MNNTIYPCIWCNNNAREMADFYYSTLPETDIVDENHILQKIVPTLMFTGAQNGRAMEAAHLYTSLFPNSEIHGVMYYTEESGEPESSVQHGEFFINDYLLMMMDSSLEHNFSFSEGVSLVVECDYQEENDNYWNALTSNGGEESMCGWLKDQFGVSWQIVPAELDEWVKKSTKVMEEVMKMKKLNIETLKNAIK